MLLENKVCLVTGANRGIGAAIVRRFVEEGATVYATARVDASLDDRCAELTSVLSGTALPIYLDVTNAVALKETFVDIKKMQGRLDVLVNNAGVMRDALIGMITQQLLDETFATNVYATINAMQYATKLMKRNAALKRSTETIQEGDHDFTSNECIAGNISIANSGNATGNGDVSSNVGAANCDNITSNESVDASGGAANNDNAANSGNAISNGSIINIASLVGVNGNKNQVVYAASKGAVIAATKSAAKELAADNIRVNAVAPGMIDTDLLSKTDQQVVAKLTQSIALGRIGTPREVADVCVWLASDLSSYVTGQVIGVDGGAVM